MLFILKSQTLKLDSKGLFNLTSWRAKLTLYLYFIKIAFIKIASFNIPLFELFELYIKYFSF